MFKHFNVERPVKVCSVLCSMHRHRNYSANSACKFRIDIIISGFPPETPTIRIVYRRSSQFYNLTNTYM